MSQSEAIHEARRHAQTLGHEPDRLGIAFSTDAAHGQAADSASSSYAAVST